MSRPARVGEQLLRTPTPQPDESLMGYILRLSESNYYETPKWILDLAGLKMDNLRNGWRKLCGDHVDFTLFKQITRLSEEEVSEMKHEIISDSDYEQCDAQWDVPINSLRFDRPMVCSYCLRENPYCRKFWDLPIITVCPQHHSLLLNICPDCRAPITWNRKSVSRCRCGCDWRETRSPELAPAQRQAMRLLMRSCGVSESEQATMSASTTPFEKLSFGDLSRVMLCLARFVSIIEPWMDPSRTENRLFHQALEEVATILGDWPDKFHRLCDRHPNKYSSRDLTSQLDRLADRPSLMFLRIAMEEHWTEVSRRSFPSYDPSPSLRFIPIEETGKRLGLSKEWVRFLVSTGRLRSAASVSDPQMTLIDAKSIDNLLREGLQILTKKMAAAELGITAKELFDLIAYGHLKIAGGPQIDGCPETVIDAESLLDLCQRVERISSPTSETAMGLLIRSKSDELMRFDKVREQLQAKNLNFGRWLQAVIDGELIPFKLCPMLGYGFENVRLKRFAFRRDQIQQYVTRLCPEPELTIPTEPLSDSVEEIQPKKKRGALLSKMTVSLMRRWDDHQLQLRLDEIGRCYDAADLKQTAEEIFQRRDVRTTTCSDSHRAKL
jgi:hypothetical protein